MQNARRGAGLQVEDRIELALGGDAELLAAARDHEGYLAQETLALSVGYEAVDGAETTIDRRSLTVNLVPVGR